MPSGLWVPIDEDAHGLNDAAFAFGMERPGWLDYPGTYHNFGCGFAFADGHSETHRWLDASTHFGQGYSAPARPTPRNGMTGPGWPPILPPVPSDVSLGGYRRFSGNNLAG